jgi:hypothetical protein
MSIIQIKLTDALCNRCGEALSEYTECTFNNKKELNDNLSDHDWYKAGSHHFCPDCIETSITEGKNVREMTFRERKTWIKDFKSRLHEAIEKAERERKSMQPEQSTKPDQGGGVDGKN